jgi:hypothetical protein
MPMLHSLWFRFIRLRHFWNAESLFKLYGHAALDTGDLNKHAQDLVVKLKHRFRREIGLGRQS